MEQTVSAVSTASGRDADCFTTMSQIKPNTSVRRGPWVTSSHVNQRSLWRELPEVSLFCIIRKFTSRFSHSVVLFLIKKN